MWQNKYKIRVTGKNPKSFIRSLYKLHIYLSNIYQDKNDYFFIVDEENYQKIKKVKTSYKIEVVNYYGPIKWKRLFRLNIVFVGSLILGFLLLFFLTHLTFDIEVVHSKKELRNLIYHELEEQGIKKFSFQVSFERQEKIVETILKKHHNEIEWMEIERIGTKYIVKVEERKLNPEKEEFKEQNIVARKEGIIIEIKAKSGEVMKAPNDYVKKGDILISGTIKNQETLMAKVKAEGEVYAETWYQSTIEMPLSYYEESLTGKQKTRFQITFLNKTLSLFDFSPYKNKRTDEKILIRNPLLPLKLSLNTMRELNVTDLKYTKEEAVIKAGELAKEKLKASLGVNDEIISQKNLKIQEKGSKIIVEVFFKVKEEISLSEEIKEIEDEDLNEE